MSKSEFFLKLKEEVINQGGALTDLIFIDDEMIEKAIKDKQTPKELACFILK